MLLSERWSIRFSHSKPWEEVQSLLLLHGAFHTNLDGEMLLVSTFAIEFFWIFRVLTVVQAGLEILYSPGWPQVRGSPPGSASCVLRWQTCATIQVHLDSDT